MLPTLFSARKRLFWLFFLLLGGLFAFLFPSSTNPPEQKEVRVTLKPDLRMIASDAKTLFTQELTIQEGERFLDLISRLGIKDEPAIAFLKSNDQTQNIARSLRPGRIVTAITAKSGLLERLLFTTDQKDRLLVVEKAGTHFVASDKKIALTQETITTRIEIQNSLFGATDEADIPESVAIGLTQVFESDIDFYRDLRKGDRFTLVYESLSYEGRLISGGKILAAAYEGERKNLNAFWFNPEPGKSEGYYTEAGKHMKKAFLKSPLEFTRVSSGFSNARRHPVLGTMRAHKGIDYAAPTGTKIRAVADGVVDFSGVQNGYGNFVLLKHQGDHATAYGHMNAIAKGIKKGARVTQGEIIGYVGQTGLATGPHLHYEFRMKGTQVDPKTLNLPYSYPLETRHRARFQTQIEAAKRLLLKGQELRL